MIDLIWFTKDDVIKLHQKIIAISGGADGARDEGLLDSALGSVDNKNTLKVAAKKAAV